MGEGTEGVASADSIRLIPADAREPVRIASLMHDTEPHVFGYLHDHDAERSRRHLGAQWARPDGIFSHVHATLAVHDDALVGFELGFDVATQRAHLEPMIDCAQKTLTQAEFAHLVSWFEYGNFVLPPIPEDAYYVQNLAAIPEARGRGIGERLLRHAFDVARERGLARVHLDVYASNPAVRLYERVGMRTIVETKVPPLEAKGIPPHLRMELKF